MNTPSVHLFRKSKNISFPLLVIFAVWWCCLQCQRLLHYRNALVFLVGGVPDLRGWFEKSSPLGNLGTTPPIRLQPRTWRQIAVWHTMCGMRHLIWWVSHQSVMRPWKNAHMLCSVHSVHSNMMRRNGYLIPYPTLGILPRHPGGMLNNRGLGMLFLRYVLCLSFVHWQSNSTPLKRSYPPLLRNTGCFQQFSAPVWFLFR